MNIVLPIELAKEAEEQFALLPDSELQSLTPDKLLNELGYE